MVFTRSYGASGLFRHRIQHQPRRAVERDLDAHLRQQAQHRRDVVEVRQVVQTERFSRQQAGAENRQRRILAPEMATSPLSGCRR